MSLTISAVDANRLVNPRFLLSFSTNECHSLPLLDALSYHTHAPQINLQKSVLSRDSTAAAPIAEKPAAGRSSVSGDSSVSGMFVGKKILVVDDAFSILKLMSQTLKNKAEAIVTQAKDGQQAVEECEKQHFDLILTDIQMPVLDGFGAAKCIRAIEKERGLPRKLIVGISANTQVT